MKRPPALQQAINDANALSTKLGSAFNKWLNENFEWLNDFLEQRKKGKIPAQTQQEGRGTKDAEVRARAEAKAKAEAEAKAKAIHDRMAELKRQGHGPDRHGPDVTEDQLRARAVEGKDPVTGTTDDAYNKNPDGTPKTHQYSANATKVNTEEAYVQGDDYLRSSDEFQDQAAGKGPGDSIKVEQPLEDIYGSDYQDKVSGVTREGSKNNPTGWHTTDFTDGKMLGVYRMDTSGNWNLVTMYPNPKP